MAEHTPTPWKAGQPGNYRIYGPANLGDQSGPIAEAKPVNTFQTTYDNRDRIVACVNAFPDHVATEDVSWLVEEMQNCLKRWYNIDPREPSAMLRESTRALLAKLEKSNG